MGNYEGGAKSVLKIARKPNNKPLVKVWPLYLQAASFPVMDHGAAPDTHLPVCSKAPGLFAGTEVPGLLLAGGLHVGHQEDVEFDKT